MVLNRMQNATEEAQKQAMKKREEERKGGCWLEITARHEISTGASLSARGESGEDDTPIELNDDDLKKASEVGMWLLLG